MIKSYSCAIGSPGCQQPIKGDFEHLLPTCLFSLFLLDTATHRDGRALRRPVESGSGGFLCDLKHFFLSTSPPLNMVLGAQFFFLPQK